MSTQLKITDLSPFSLLRDVVLTGAVVVLALGQTQPLHTQPWYIQCLMGLLLFLEAILLVALYCRVKDMRISELLRPKPIWIGIDPAAGPDQSVVHYPHVPPKPAPKQNVGAANGASAMRPKLTPDAPAHVTEAEGKPKLSPGVASRVVSAEEYRLLGDIAYCVGGMLGSENEGNMGDARDWKRRLRLQYERYDDLVHGDGTQ